MLMPRRGLALMARALRRPSAPTAVGARWAAPVPLLQQQLRLMSSLEPPRAAEKRKPKKKQATSKPKAQKKESLPSFAIDAAFEDEGDLADDIEESGLMGDDILQSLYGDEEDAQDDDAEDKRAKEMKEQFRRGVEKKKLWMQSLGEQQAFATVLKSVADCYAPLYAAMGLEGSCPLLRIAQKAASATDDLETPFQPQRFDDTLTKMTEQEALAILVVAKQTQLSIAIVEHRLQLGDRLSKLAERGKGLVLPGQDVMADKQAVTLGSHFRSFYSFAMGAYSLAGRVFREELFAMFERAEKDGIYPTGNMNATYLAALILERRFDEVFEFYDLVTRESRPSSVFFYRQLLFAVGVTRNTEELQQVLHDMRVKGYKLRPEEYLHAMRAYDDEYFLVRTSLRQGNRNNFKKSVQAFKNNHKNNSNNIEWKTTTPTENYIACLKQLEDQDKHPERYENLMGAAHSVVELFDEMVNVEGLSPHFKQFYPRVISAAVYAREYERVPEILALHAKHAAEDEPLHYAGVRMAINAFLLMDRPMEALQLLRETYPDLESWQLTHMANILDYLGLHDRAADIVSILQDAKERGLLAVFTTRVLKKVTPALCRSVDSISDDELVQLMTQYEDVFGVHTSIFHFKMFVRECAYVGRLGAMWSVLRNRDPSMGGGFPLNGKLGAIILGKIDADTDPTLVAMLIGAIDLKTVQPNEQRDVILAACERTFEALGRPKTTKRIRRLLERQQ